MGRITVSETISAPVSAVFAYVDDYRNTTKYMKDMTKWEPAGSQTHGLGSRFALSMKVGPLNIDGEVEIDTWVENQAIGWKTLKGFKQDGSWSFEEKGGGTEATFSVDLDLPGGIAGKMMAKAVEPAIKATLEGSVKQLKAQTEKLGT
ncbi:MAG: SRPBCC family protein [Candidatus Dormibacteria bacterium]